MLKLIKYYYMCFVKIIKDKKSFVVIYNLIDNRKSIMIRMVFYCREILFKMFFWLMLMEREFGSDMVNLIK